MIAEFVSISIHLGQMIPSSQEQAHKVELKGSYISTERSTAISDHLKLISVKYNVVDDRILQLLKFLCTYNIGKLTGNTSHAFIILYILKFA